MRKIFCVLCGVSLFFVVAFIGGAETGGSLTRCIIGSGISLAAFAGFGFLGGLFRG